MALPVAVERKPRPRRVPGGPAVRPWRSSAETAQSCHAFLAHWKNLRFNSSAREGHGLSTCGSSWQCTSPTATKPQVSGWAENNPWAHEKTGPEARQPRGPRTRLCLREARCYSAVSVSVMLAAAVLPAPMARMTVAAPVTMSPPAQMRGLEVRPFSSATM